MDPPHNFARTASNWRHIVLCFTQSEPREWPRSEKLWTVRLSLTGALKEAEICTTFFVCSTISSCHVTNVNEKRNNKKRRRIHYNPASTIRCLSRSTFCVSYLQFWRAPLPKSSFPQAPQALEKIGSFGGMALLHIKHAFVVCQIATVLNHGTIHSSG